jgi:hypothetical protein
VIGDDCWIGYNAFIKRGVVIGKGAIVAANSSVTRDVPPYSVVAGSPARVIKERLAFLPLDQIDAADETCSPFLYQGFGLSHDERPDTGNILAEKEFCATLKNAAGRLKIMVDAKLIGPSKRGFLCYGEERQALGEDFSECRFSAKQDSVFHYFRVDSASAGTGHRFVLEVRRIALSS